MKYTPKVDIITQIYILLLGKTACFGDQEAVSVMPLAKAAKKKAPPAMAATVKSIGEIRWERKAGTSRPTLEAGPLYKSRVT